MRLGLNLLRNDRGEAERRRSPVFTVVDNTKIILSVPANATSGRFSVTGPGSTPSRVNSYTVPGKGTAVTGFSPQFRAGRHGGIIVGRTPGTAARDLQRR